MKLHYLLMLLAAPIVAIGFERATVLAATAVTYAAGQSVDSDGDGVYDLFDNAPGVYNPSQVDTDGDQYGDIIDPTPNIPGPVVDIGFSIGGTYTVTPGSGVTIQFTTTNSPPGDFGQIYLYLQPSVPPDAYAFQSLAAPGGSFYIPANLVTIPGFWDLNTVGTYTVEAWGLAPGEIAGYQGGTAIVNVVPEPTSLGLAVGALIILLLRRLAS